MSQDEPDEASRVDDASLNALNAELEKRGLGSSFGGLNLQELEKDGPSAFKDAKTVVEYVMLNLQHRERDGIVEAFRFTMPPPNECSSITGDRLSANRLSWRTGRIIEGMASGRGLGFDAFAEEMHEHYALLLGCAVWSFASQSSSSESSYNIPGNQHKKPSGSAGPEGGTWRNRDEGWEKNFLLEVDDRHVNFKLLYDWGAWCYCVVRVEVLPSLASSSIGTEAA